MISFNDSHFVDDNLLTEIALASFVVDLVFDFILVSPGGRDVLDVAQLHSVNYIAIIYKLIHNKIYYYLY